MNKELICLALARCRELAREAFSVHQELEKWRETPFTSMERTKLSLKINHAVEEQDKWLRILGDYIEESTED
ncbi:MAG TPA: hypothetical protein VEA69_21100 [Tepidisphaeraceae bacterium]|nr:hypothetical protein [Tepidisphaeraceae bacterium]